MHVVVLFPEDGLMSMEDIRNTNGARSANLAFLRALVRYGHNHGIAVTVVADVPQQFLRDAPARWDILRDELEGDVEILSLAHLPRLFAERPVDVLHRLTQHLYRSLYIRNAIARRPVVLTGVTHGLSYANFHEWVLLTLLGRPQPTDRLVCTTTMAEEVVQSFAATAGAGLGGEISLPTTVIPLGVEVERFGGHDPGMRRRLGIPDDAVLLLSVARFSHLTKVDLRPLLTAFRRIVDRTSTEVHLVLAGATGGENYPQLMEASAAECGIADRLHLVENPPEPDKLALYRAADVFISLGDNPQETFGLAILEASVSALPVVASDWSGFRTLVDDTRTGYLIPTTALKSCPPVDILTPLYHNVINLHLASQSVATDLDVLCDRLVDLVDRPDLRRTLGEAGRAFAQEFDWARIVEQYVALWSTLRAWTTRCVIDPDRPPRLDFRNSFASYPTRVLDPDDAVTTSSAGADLLRGSGSLQSYSGLAEVISAEVVTQVLQRAMPGVSAGLLQSELSDVANPDLVAFHAIWLYKYGLVSIAPASARPSQGSV
jgi:glycosyltransferase involved in cell wall biosynthesis